MKIFVLLAFVFVCGFVLLAFVCGCVPENKEQEFERVRSYYQHNLPKDAQIVEVDNGWCIWIWRGEKFMTRSTQPALVTVPIKSQSNLTDDGVYK